MQTRRIDPVRDPSWLALIERHPRASVFHTPEWLDALRRTYGYEPVVITTTPPGRELANGVVFCSVSSWLTGHRFVSLPFSDHCDPLVDEPRELCCILGALRDEWKCNGLKYIELRPLIRLWTVYRPEQIRYFLPSPTGPAPQRRGPLPGITPRLRSEEDSARGTGKIDLRRGPVGADTGEILPLGRSDAPEAVVAATAARLVSQSDSVHGRQDEDTRGIEGRSTRGGDPHAQLQIHARIQVWVLRSAARQARGHATLVMESYPGS